MFFQRRFSMNDRLSLFSLPPSLSLLNNGCSSLSSLVSRLVAIKCFGRDLRVRRRGVGAVQPAPDQRVLLQRFLDRIGRRSGDAGVEGLLRVVVVVIESRRRPARRLLFVRAVHEDGGLLFDG